MSDVALARVRRAYELAHLGAAARGLAIAAAIALLAVAVHQTSAVTWLVSGALAVVLAVLGWRGGAWRRGAFAGVLAGLPPLIVPSLVYALQAQHCSGCETVAAWPCVLACFGTSSVVGALVGYGALTDRSPRRFAAGALATAALTGLVGCGTIGLGGALGIVVGIVAGGVTGWTFAPRARA